MHHPYSSTLTLAVLALATACGGSATESDLPPAAAAPDSAPAAASPDPAVAEPPATPTTPVDPAPVVATPSTPPPIEAPPPPAPQGPLRVVALRDGPMTIFRQHDAPLLALEGEPVARVGGVFTRNPLGGGGLVPLESSVDEPATTLAVVDLQDPLGAWTSIEHEQMRSSSIYGVYQRTAQQWQAKNLHKGLLVGYYAALVERDGALLALQRWAPDIAQELGDEDGSDEAEALRAKLASTLARAKPSWVTLAGPKPATTPKIPAKLQLTGSVASADDGSILALAQERAGDEQAHVLLMWPAGESTAERIDVPELRGASNVAVMSSGEWSFVTGDVEVGEETAPYLAMGRGREWQHVPVTLPRRIKNRSPHLNRALRTPDGELWITMGHRWDGDDDDQSVWRKPVEGAWAPVSLPEVSSRAYGPAKSWVIDPMDESRGWVEVDRPRGRAELGRATSLVWADGAVWIAVHAGYGLEGLSETPTRSALLTTQPGTAPITVLEPAWQMLLERRNHARRGGEPGSQRCQDFSLVLGPAALATKPKLIEALGELSSPDGDRGTIDAVYVATLDGAQVLVASAHSDSPKYASSMRKKASLALREAGVEGGTALGDCRIPLLSKMVSSFSEPYGEPSDEPSGEPSGEPSDEPSDEP